MPAPLPAHTGGSVLAGVALSRAASLRTATTRVSTGPSGCLHPTPVPGFGPKQTEVRGNLSIDSAGLGAKQHCTERLGHKAERQRGPMPTHEISLGVQEGTDIAADRVPVVEEALETFPWKCQGQLSGAGLAASPRAVPAPSLCSRGGNAQLRGSGQDGMGWKRMGHTSQHQPCHLARHWEHPQRWARRAAGEGKAASSSDAGCCGTSALSRAHPCVCLFSQDRTENDS